MARDKWKVYVVVEQIDYRMPPLDLFFKVYAENDDELNEELKWRLEWLGDTKWTVVDKFKITKDTVYGDI
jgi:hypothetical protein